MTDTDPSAPPTDRHPRSSITRLPYALVIVVVLLAAIIWGAVTVRERETADREMFGAGRDAAQVEQAISNPQR